MRLRDSAPVTPGDRVDVLMVVDDIAYAIVLTAIQAGGSER